MCLAQGPQRSDAGEARAKHSTSEPLRSPLTIFAESPVVSDHFKVPTAERSHSPDGFHGSISFYQCV